jgi:hypothetical protein
VFDPATRKEHPAVTELPPAVWKSKHLQTVRIRNPHTPTPL